MLANLVPLLAVVICLAEYLLDHHQPRYTSPTFWIALIATIGLLVGVQLLRFGGTGRPQRMAKPDYSATNLMRRRVAGDDDDQG